MTKARRSVTRESHSLPFLPFFFLAVLGIISFPEADSDCLDSLWTAVDLPPQIANALPCCLVDVDWAPISCGL